MRYRVCRHCFLTLLACCLWVVAGHRQLLSEDSLRFNSHEFERTRAMAQLWVEYERLPSTHDKTTATDEAEFAKAWSAAYAAAVQVEKAWTEAFAEDPLLQCASTCLNRYVDLQPQYSTLRNGLRKRYGFDKFREFERKSHDWYLTNGNPWLDLEDTNLVRLLMWWAEYAQSDGQQTAGKSPQPYQWLTAPNDWVTQWTTSTLSLTEEDVTNAAALAVLTEEQALALFKKGVRQKRAEDREKNAELRASLQLPPAMWEYLRIRQEADAMHWYSYSYLQINLPKHPTIAAAEAKLATATQQVTSLRPYALFALHSVHTERMFARIKVLELQEAKLRALVAQDTDHDKTSVR